MLVWMGHYGHDLHKPSHLQVNLRRRGSWRAASPHTRTHTLCIIMIHYFLIHYDSLCSFAEILAHEPHSIERMCGQGSCELFYLYRMVALDHSIKFQREYFFISRSSMKFSDFFLPLPWQCLCRSLSKLYRKMSNKDRQRIANRFAKRQARRKVKKDALFRVRVVGILRGLGFMLGLDALYEAKGHALFVDVA